MVMFDDGNGGGPALYVGGHYVNSGTTPLNGIARWNGVSWESVGGGVAGTGFQVGVHALAVFDDGKGGGPALYAGGRFVSAGGVAADGIARWNGSVWSPVGNGQMGPASSLVTTLLVHDDGNGPTLFMGGGFTSVGGVSALRLAKWDGEHWTQVGNGMGGGVWALATFDAGRGEGPVLIAGGVFGSAGGAPANEVAMWDGEFWSALGTGLPGVGVYSLAVFDDGLGGGPTLFAGGLITIPGTPAVTHVARWTGTTWTNVSPNNIGANNGVYSLGVFDDETGGGPALYAGGEFTSIGGTPAIRIAKWNGVAWSALGSGMNGTGWELLSMPSAGGEPAALYIGGSFLMAGGNPANCIAKWQGCIAETCAPADLNCDGVVDGADLGMLLASWGPCSDCAADLNGDGLVDGADLGQLLGEWS